jgi:hypothetical protein
VRYLTNDEACLHDGHVRTAVESPMVDVLLVRLLLPLRTVRLEPRFGGAFFCQDVPELTAIFQSENFSCLGLRSFTLVSMNITRLSDSTVIKTSRVCVIRPTAPS